MELRIWTQRHRKGSRTWSKRTFRNVSKTESQLHKILKNAVARELKKQNFSTFQEPLESPYNHLWWHSYRPDVLATKNTDKNLQVTLVECETKPNKKRLSEKMTTIQNNLSLQKRLFERTHVLPLLVIPPFNLTRILCSEVRSFWEIWIVNSLGIINQKIYRKKEKKAT